MLRWARVLLLGVHLTIAGSTDREDVCNSIPERSSHGASLIQLARSAEHAQSQDEKVRAGKPATTADSKADKKVKVVATHKVALEKAVEAQQAFAEIVAAEKLVVEKVATAIEAKQEATEAQNVLAQKAAVAQKATTEKAAAEKLAAQKAEEEKAAREKVVAAQSIAAQKTGAAKKAVEEQEKAKKRASEKVAEAMTAKEKSAELQKDATKKATLAQKAAAEQATAQKAVAQAAATQNAPDTQSFISWGVEDKAGLTNEVEAADINYTGASLLQVAQSTQMHARPRKLSTAETAEETESVEGADESNAVVETAAVQEQSMSKSTSEQSRLAGVEAQAVAAHKAAAAKAIAAQKAFAGTASAVKTAADKAAEEMVARAKTTIALKVAAENALAAQKAFGEAAMAEEALAAAAVTAEPPTSKETRKVSVEKQTAKKAVMENTVVKHGEHGDIVQQSSQEEPMTTAESSELSIKEAPAKKVDGSIGHRPSHEKQEAKKAVIENKVVKHGEHGGIVHQSSQEEPMTAAESSKPSIKEARAKKIDGSIGHQPSHEKQEAKQAVVEDRVGKQQKRGNVVQRAPHSKQMAAAESADHSEERVAAKKAKAEEGVIKQKTHSTVHQPRKKLLATAEPRAFPREKSAGKQDGTEMAGRPATSRKLALPAYAPAKKSSTQLALPAYAPAKKSFAQASARRVTAKKASKGAVEHGKHRNHARRPSQKKRRSAERGPRISMIDNPSIDDPSFVVNFGDHEKAASPNVIQEGVQAAHSFHDVVGTEGVFLLDLERKPERAQFAEDKLKVVGIFPKKIPATDSRETPQHVLAEACNEHCTPVEAAIAHSHKRAIEAAALREENWTAIFEDDAVPVLPHGMTGSRWDDEFRQVWTQVPAETKVVRLSWCLPTGDGHLISPPLGEGEMMLTKFHPAGMCTAAYMVHKDIIPRLLEIFPCNCALDCCLNWKFWEGPGPDGKYLHFSVLSNLEMVGSTSFIKKTADLRGLDMHGIIMQAFNELGTTLEVDARDQFLTSGR